MAKGDQNKVQNSVDYRGNTALNDNTNQRQLLLSQNQPMQNHYTTSYDQNYNDYLNNTGTGQSQYGNISSTPVTNFGAYSGYQDFANTGGYSPDQIAAMRQMSNAPIAANYANAKADLDRQKALTGGYMPNYAGALTKMTNQQAIASGQQSMNTEAMLAQAINQGKLAGLSGMTNIDQALNNITNTRLGLGNQAYGNIVSNYASTPGQANMAGNQLNQSSSLLNQNQTAEDQIMQMIINGQLGEAQVPGDYQQGLGNVASTIGLGSGLAGMFTGGGQFANIFGGGPGGGTSPIQGSFSTPTVNYGSYNPAFTGWAS